MANILTQRIIAFAVGYGAKEDSKEMDNMCSHGAHLTKLSGKKIKYPPLNDLSEFYHQKQSINYSEKEVFIFLGCDRFVLTIYGGQLIEEIIMALLLRH
jgi:hypothetical protein